MIIVKSKREIELMKEANRIVGGVIRIIAEYVKPGITTLELDKIAEKYIISEGAIPAFKGYKLHNSQKGFPGSICASVNDEVVHGIPGPYVLKEGDIISVDVGTLKNGFYGDTAYTFPVGKISEEAEKLLKVTKNALYIGIDQARPKNRVGDISYAIQSYVESYGFSVVREYVGHGIGKSLHEDPQIPNYGRKGVGPLLRQNMTIAIEPMVNIGSYEVKVKSNGWTVATKDGSLSAHFEHTILINEDGPEILSVWGI